MLVNNSKTSWFHLAIIIAVTAVSLYYIKTAFAKPFAQFEDYNQIRAAELKQQLQ